MTNHLKAAVLSFGLAMPLLSGPIIAAQQKKPTHPAPIPAQILAAKRIFIANGGGDESHYEEASYSGRPDRVYNEFYAATKAWGRYELVAAPADADLVFEIRLTIFQLQRVRVLSDDSPAFDSQFRIVIRDAKSHQTLWGLTKHAQGAVLRQKLRAGTDRGCRRSAENRGASGRGPREELASLRKFPANARPGPARWELSSHVWNKTIS